MRLERFRASDNRAPRAIHEPMLFVDEGDRVMQANLLRIVVWHHSAGFDLPDLNAILKEAHEVTEPETGRGVIQKSVDSLGCKVVEGGSLSIPASAVREPCNAMPSTVIAARSNPRLRHARASPRSSNSQ